MKTNCILCLIVALLFTNLKLSGQIKLSYSFTGEILAPFIINRWYFYERQVDKTDNAATKIHGTNIATDELPAVPGRTLAVSNNETMVGARQSSNNLTSNSSRNMTLRIPAEYEQELNIEPWMLDLGKKVKHKEFFEDKLVMEDWMLRPAEWLN